MQLLKEAVPPEQLSLPHFPRFRLLCGLAVILLGSATLVGWLTGARALAGFGTSYLPMAPDTAVAFLALGTALAVLIRQPVPRWALWVARLEAGGVAVLASLRLCEHVPGLAFGTDRWFLAPPAQYLEQGPTGHTPYQTEISLLLAGATILLLTWAAYRPEAATAAGVLACAVTATGLIFFFGYLYGPPFLSQRAIIPMALNTSVGFVVLGVGLIATSGLEVFPLRRLSGPSVHARLLRAFLPFTAVTVCVVAWLMHLVGLYVDAESAALLSAFLAVVAIFPVGLICARIARLVGSELERAEQELRQAERQSRSYADEVQVLNLSLEERVAGRTAELADSRDRFEKVNQELKDRNERLQQLADDLAATALSEGQAHRALRESEQRLQAILDNSTAVVYLKDVDSRFLLINRRFEELFHIARKQVVGKTNHDLFPGEWADAFRANDLKVLEQKRPLEFEEVAPQDDGTHTYISIKFPLYDSAGTVYGICGISTDITARKRAEEALRSSEETLRIQNALLQEMAQSERQAHDALKKAQAQLVQTEKLAALGQLVAGVAHEINNPLSFVSNNVAVLQRDVSALRDLQALYQQAGLEKHEPELAARIRALSEHIDLKYTLGNLDGLLTRSRDGLKRIQQIVKDLRDFARLDESELQEVDLNAGIESTLNIIQGQARKQQVALDLDLAPLPMVSCYPAKINQVVLNLVTNAIDACPPGSKVMVGTRSAADGVEIIVSDTGSGIDPSIREKIFDPFFTTKPQGKGTGLGLSISYGIVQAHGGTIAFESTVGLGTRFVVHLPRKLPAEVKGDVLTG
jgi:PAS domain S-box-containing protein